MNDEGLNNSEREEEVRYSPLEINDDQDEDEDKDCYYHHNEDDKPITTSSTTITSMMMKVGSSSSDRTSLKDYAGDDEIFVEKGEEDIDQQQGIEMCLPTSTKKKKPSCTTVKERLSGYVSFLLSAGTYTTTTTTATSCPFGVVVVVEEAPTPSTALAEQEQRQAAAAARKKRNLILVSTFGLILLLVIIIGSVCGSGRCGGGSSSTAAPGDASSSIASSSGSQDDTSNGPEDKSGGGEGGGTVPFPPPTTGENLPLEEMFGSSPENNIIVFDSQTWTTDQIQTTLDDIFHKQQNNEMGNQRFGVYFLPGIYGSASQPLHIQIGYGTEISGLGMLPSDVVVNGRIEVYNRCFEPDPYEDGKFVPTSDTTNGLCFALNSFWRSLSNLQINIVMGSNGNGNGDDASCRSTAMFWAISQASSMRRVHITGASDVSLMDYCSNPAYASGGFIADTKIDNKIISGSQQQFFTRNSNIGTWDGSVWNQMFAGVTFDSDPVDDTSYPDPPFTVLLQTPISREKPFLYVDGQDNLPHIYVPAASMRTRGVSWQNGFDEIAGKSIPLSQFYIVHPSSDYSITVINQYLKAGHHLLFTPGVYDIDKSILVTQPNTVVLGLGQATLTAVNGAVPLKLSHQPGIVVAGITIDAGTALSPVLLQVGEPNSSNNNNEHHSNPITLSDVYFRLGGPHIGKATVCLEVNSDHVLIDHTWIWRADHGVEGFDTTQGFEGDDIRWKTNIGHNGLVVNGNDVTATGLFVEHFQKHNVIWNGERGRVYFFQNELPYEPPSQDEWMNTNDNTLGWAAYKVSDHVQDHELYGGGVYCYNRNDPSIVTSNGFEVPSDGRQGITLKHIMTRNLSGPGKVQSVINDIGDTVDSDNQGPSYVVNYPQ